MTKKFVAFIIIMGAAFYYYLEHDMPSNERVIRVGVECDHAPYNWEDDKPHEYNFPLINKLGYYTDGYDVQMAALIAEKLDAKVVFIKVHWDDLLRALQRKEIDVIFSGMVDTEDRKKIINFTEPYEVRKTEYSVLMNTESKYTGAKTLKDLSGAKIIAQTDSRFDEVIDQIPGVVHMPPASTQGALLNNLINFKVDGIVINFDTALAYEKTYTNLAVIHFSEGEGFELGFNGVCAGLRKSDTKLFDDINNAIKSITQKERQRIMDQTISRVWEKL